MKSRKAGSCSEVTLRKTIDLLLQTQSMVRLLLKCCKSNGCHCKTSCAGQAAAVSAYTQVKNGGRSKIARNEWSDTEDPVVLVGRGLWRHRLAGLLRERQFKDVLLDMDGKKYRIVHRQQGLFLSVLRG